MKKLYCIIPILILFLFAIADLPSSQISAQSACLQSCSSCTTTTTCTNTTYDTCDTSPCRASGATSTTLFRCYASSNSNCSGSYQCSSCATTTTAPPPPPPPATCAGISCGGSCYEGCQDNYTFICSGGNAYCCPDNYPKYCSNINKCVKSNWDCNNYVANCGGYQYYFCPVGTTATCTNNTPSCPAPTPTPTPTPTPAPTPVPLPPQVPTGETPTTYTIATGYSSTQGPIWYYYYKFGTDNPAPAVYEPGQWIWYDVPAGSPYWNGPGDDWMMLTPGYSAGDSKIAILYWKAPKQGIASMTVTDQAMSPGKSDNGWKFGAGYVPSVGSWPASFLNTVTNSGADSSVKSFTVNQQMRSGEALLYFKDSNGSVYGDEAKYTVSITFTPTQDATTASPTPTPTPTGPQGTGSCGTGTARATDLVSTPDLTGTFSTSSGACIIDPKAAFAPFKIPTFDDLKSLYFDQKR